jgi:HlyD family secretion protein
MPDIARDPAILRRRRRRQAALAVVLLTGLAGASVALARLEPAPPTVDRSAVLEDTVKRGAIVVQVRGLGTLVPEDTRWIPAATDGRVERILLHPGDRVGPDSIILELSNPQVEQEVVDAKLALQSQAAALDNLRAQLQGDLLTAQAQAASLEADHELARMDAEANDRLAQEQLVSELQRRQSQLKADTLQKKIDLERKRLDAVRAASEARIRQLQVAVDQARAVADLRAERLARLRVRPGFSGVLQQVPVEVGARVAPGQNLARVADPARLKAELKIPETQARDIEIGQPAAIDTRSAIIPGRVSRKAPAAVNGTVTVDVTLTGELPRGAVPDMTVDGTVQLARLDNVLYVGRPARGQEQTTISLFRIAGEDGTASRVTVALGRSSVNAVEVKSGLAEGDRVVLSDMSNWDGYDRVRLK